MIDRMEGCIQSFMESKTRACSLSSNIISITFILLSHIITYFLLYFSIMLYIGLNHFWAITWCYLRTLLWVTHFHGIKSYTDKVHIDEKTEKDHGFSPKMKKVKILDKTEYSNVGENIEVSVIKEQESSKTDKNKDRNRNENNNKNRNKSNANDGKNSDTADSSSGPSSVPLPTEKEEEKVEDKVVLDSATASDRTKQIKLLVLLKILKKFEVTNCVIFLDLYS